MMLPKILSFLALLSTCLATAPALAADHFPHYPAITANVAFWEKIYSTYSINTIVVHDKNDVTKIYETVQLVDKDLPAASQINSTMISFATTKYQRILQDLADGKRPATVEEKRIASMYKGRDSRGRMAKAAQSVRTQKGQKERFLEGVVRSGRYLPTIRAIFKEHGLPSELAYLPHVESSFNIKAYSKAGASGMWQFTLGTGKQYMRIDDAVDERSDPYIAARAAARYLRDGYQKLGSWPLALTAYNYGTAGMVRAKTAKGSYERIFLEYREGNFGFASQNFYAEFLAAIHVAKKLEASRQVRLDRPVDFVEYRLPSYIHLRNVKRHFGVTDAMIDELNPAIRPPVYRGEKLLPAGYHLRLPATRHINALIARVPDAYFQREQTRGKYHLVRPGETLTQIAAKYQIKVRTLAAANGLRHDAKVRIGQRLRIPPETASRTSSSVRSLSAAEAKRHRSSTNTKSSPPASEPLVLSAETSKIEYISAN